MEKTNYLDVNDFCKELFGKTIKELDKEELYLLSDLYSKRPDLFAEDNFLSRRFRNLMIINLIDDED